MSPLARAGQRDPALEWIEKAWLERDDDLVWLKRDPVYDPVRAHPKSQALLERIGLALRPHFSLEFTDCAVL